MTIIQVRVKPGSRVSSFEQSDDGVWQARVKSPPVDGKANQELVALIAGHFGVPRSRVVISRGASARVKRVKIDEP